MEFQLRGVGDPRLAVHATSAQPAWLWSPDGTRILWANPVGASLFGAAHAPALADKIFGPADPQRRQVAQLASRLPVSGAIRLERLRGFGASLGALVTCGCARLDFADGSQGVLVAVAEPVGRSMPLIERLQRLVDGIDMPIAAFSREGRLIGASHAARTLLAFRDLSEAGLDAARNDALKQGRVETPVGIGHLVLQRVGSGADIGLVALIEPGPVTPPAATAAPAEPVEERVATSADQATADHEPPASSEAASEIAITDEFAAPLSDAVEQHVGEEHAEEQIVGEYAASVPTPEAEPAPQHVASEEASPQQTLPRESSAQESSSQGSSSEEASSQESPPQEPSPYVEAVADEPPSADTPAPLEPPASAPRRHPLRFIWQMDADGRFSLGTDEFTHLIGHRTASGFGRLWSEIATAFALDPEDRVRKAIATRDTFSGIILSWPVDGGARLPVELAGLPMFDRAHNFAGYRGFGVCRDLDGLSRLAALRRHELIGELPPQPLSAAIVAPDAQAAADHTSASETSHPTDLEASQETFKETFKETLKETLEETHVETPNETLRNVVPFRPNNEPKSPVLTPVENNAFNELARQLAERLDRNNITSAKPEEVTLSEAPSSEMLSSEALAEASPAEAPASETTTPETLLSEAAPAEAAETVADQPVAAEPPALTSAQPGWLAHPEAPARGESRRDKTLLDLLPIGVLIYRLDRLLYANRAFLERMGYPSLQALEEAGGLDALYVEPGVSSASSTSDTGTPVTISASQNLPNQVSPDHASAEHAPPATTEAHLYTITWDEDSALALIFSPTPAAPAVHADPVATETVAAEPSSTESAAIEPVMDEPVVDEPSAVGHANAEELGAILDTTAEGIVMFDAEGNIHACNRSAEALFGHDGPELVQRNLVQLFAPESQDAIRDYLKSIKGADIASLLDHGRDVLAQVRGGGLIPVSVTMGRTQPHGPNFFAVFRDLSQARKSESELREARRLADRAANAKSDMLARISHEVRHPLNAIIGFAEVMIGERFGALGNERYGEYMKDIRASGERVIAIINDLLDLSRIETGKLDLAFANQNLNDLVEQCVAVMQPQANRERIIIRTSLAHTLPPVVADARALRQITLNLIGNSIHLANAGGQVIVSTALSDLGSVVLRVRDTGHGLNDNEVAAAMEPFRTQAPSDQAADASAVSLSLTKALVEANRAQFQIKTGAHSGTLIEVVFSPSMARAQP